MPLLSNDAWKRMSKAVREAEADRRSEHSDPDPIPPPYMGIVVEVTSGTPVTITTTTPSYTSSTTSTSSTSTSSTSSTSTTQPTTKQLYPAKFVYRNMDSLTNAEWWHLGEVCWIQEVHGETLSLGDRFPGQIVAEYQSVSVVAVRKSSGGISDGGSEICRITGTGTVVGTIRLLPAVIEEVENVSDVLTWIDEISVWVIQRNNYVLSNGFSCHAKKSSAGDYDLSGDTRPIYITADREWC